MKTLITKRSVLIASIAFLLALITLVSVNVFQSVGPVTGFANTVTRPVRTLASSVAQIFESIFSSIYRYDALLAENENLLVMIAQYELNLKESEELAEDNARLRQLLAFRERHAGYEHVQATFISWGADNWSSTFIINKGYLNSEIERGMPIATEYGMLLGQVFEVGPTTSTVITILDTTFSAAASVTAYIEDEDIEDVDGTVTYRGIIDESDSSVTAKGNFTYMSSRLLTLDNIHDDLIVRPGDRVITSGHGGFFPKGLIIGRVEEVFRHTSGIGRFATVKPLREIDTIGSTVFIITDFENID